MMQGITALPGAQQGPQAQAPGQATPFQALPAAQPKTPGIAQTPALSQQSTDALLAMYRNPKLLEGTPYSLYGVIGALSQQLKAEAADEAAKNNAAMAAYGQQVQQPPVAEGLAQQAAMLARPTQMARHGGIMHGYAGGGAVAFEHGGRVQKFALGSDEDGVRPFYRRPAGAMPAPTPGETFFPATTGFEGMSLPEFFEALLGKAKRAFGSEEENVERRNRERAAKELEERMGPLMRSYKGRPSMSEEEMHAAYENAGLRATPPLPVPAPTQPRANRPGTGMAAAPAPAAAPTGGIADLAGPNIDPYLLSAREAQRLTAEAAMRGAKPTAEQIEARRGLDALMGSVVTERQAEEARRLAQAQKRIEEALGRSKRAPLEDITYLGQMLEGMRGSKRFGEALSGAAAGAGRAQAARQEALRKAEERYDMSRNDIAALASLRQQLQIDQAKAVEARASGNARAEQEAMLKVAQSRQQLAEFEAGLADKAEGRRIQRQQLALTASEGAADRASRERLAAIARESGGDPRKIYDTIIDNVQKEYDAWSKSLEGVSAKPEQKAAKRNELLQQQIRIASAAGVKGLEGLLAAGAPAPTAPPLTGWGKATEVK